MCAYTQRCLKGEKWGGTVEAGLGPGLPATAVNSRQLNNSGFNVVCPEKTEPVLGENALFCRGFSTIRAPKTRQDRSDFVDNRDAVPAVSRVVADDREG